MVKKEKYLEKRGNVYWLRYRLPKRILESKKYGDATMISQSLHTDSLTIAKQLRDKAIVDITTIEDRCVAILKEIEEKSKTYVSTNKLLPTYSHFVASEVINRSMIAKRKDNWAGGHKNLEDFYTDDDKFLLNVIYNKNKKNANEKSANYLLELVLKEQDGQLSVKTLSKTKRGVKCYLEYLGKSDIDITDITYSSVSQFIIKNKESVSGSTLKGYLYGLGQVWERARKSNVLTNNISPFIGHKIKKNTQSYDVFTMKEVKELYAAADANLKTIIHAAFVTGARVGELLTCEVKTPSTVDFKCFILKFKDKGKNEHSTRVVPIHSSLSLDEGFGFKMSARTLSRDFKMLVDSVIINKKHELNGKDRKLSFHSFRSTLITELIIEKEVSYIAVAAITGHIEGVKLGAIKSYIHDDDLQKKRDTVEKIIW